MKSSLAECVRGSEPYDYSFYKRNWLLLPLILITSLAFSIVVHLIRGMSTDTIITMHAYNNHRCCQLNKVLMYILEDQFTSPHPCSCPRTTSPWRWTTKSLKTCQGLRILQTVCYEWSREVQKIGYSIHVCMRYSEEWLLNYITHYSLISVSKPFSLVTQCCYPRAKSLSSRILEDKFTSPCLFVLVLQSPCPYPRTTIRPWPWSPW